MVFEFDTNVGTKISYIKSHKNIKKGKKKEKRKKLLEAIAILVSCIHRLASKGGGPCWS
jgi:hypothetical protein